MKRSAGLVAAAVVVGALSWTFTQAGVRGTPTPATASQPARTTHQVAVATLSEGPPPAIDYLTGRTLHTASGETVTVDVPAEQADTLELLGRSADGGWVVVQHGFNVVLDVAPSGATRQIATGDEEFPSTFRLSSNGNLISIQTNDQEMSSAIVQVVDLSGAQVDRHEFDDAGNVVGFTGRRLYFTQFEGNDTTFPTLVWRMGQQPHSIGVPGAEQVDVAHDQTVRAVSDADQYRYGVATFPAPSKVRWRFCYSCRSGYVPGAFSPNGDRIVLEHWVGHHANLDESVRAAATGQVTSDLHFSMPVVAERWESDHALVVEVRHGPVRTGAHALVRCTLDGACTRVSPWQRHWLLTWSPEKIHEPVPLPATSHRIRVAHLRTDSGPTADYVTGRLLHTADGKQISIDVPSRYQNSMQLLGRSARGGWVLGYHHASEILALSRSGKTRVITNYHQPLNGDWQLHLSTNGRLVAIESYPPHSVRVRVVDLAGRTVGQYTWSKPGRIVAFHGRMVWFSEASLQRRSVFHPGPLFRWRIGSTPLQTGLAGVDLLDLQRREATRIIGLVPAQQDGVVSMTDPDTVRWGFCQGCRRGFRPTAFSPDGSHLLLLGGAHQGKDVSIRSAVDGTTVSDLVFSLPADDLRWQDDDHVLVEVVGGRAEHDVFAMVRCTLDGECARVSDWQRGPLWWYFQE